MEAIMGIAKRLTDEIHNSLGQKHHDVLKEFGVYT
jgi:hypothetical protein